MNNTYKLIIGAIVVIVIVWIGYSLLIDQKTQTPKIQPATGEPIKIGFIGPLTGDAATYGEPISNAVRLAVDEVNKSGGVDGRIIEVIYEDGKCTGKDAVNAVQKLVNVDKIKIIIGGVCSGEALAILPITEPANVLVLSPAASSPDLTGAGDLFFRNSPSDSDGGKALAKLIIEKHNKIAIISEQTDYAQALANVFMKNFESLGGEIVMNENFAPKTNDFRSILTKIKETNSETILINPQTEIAGGIIVKQIRELGITVPLYGTVALAGSNALEIAGINAEDMLIVDAPGLSPDNPKAVKFLEDYRTKYGEPTLEFYIGAAYDDVFILAQAISEVGIDTQKIRNYLHEMKSYSGVIGTYKFDDNGDLAGIEYVVKKVENGIAKEVK